MRLRTFCHSSADPVQENTKLRQQTEEAQERSMAADRRQQAERHKQVPLCHALACSHCRTVNTPILQEIGDVLSCKDTASTRQRGIRL